MWVVCYRELRSLTNSKAIELNPLELSWVHDKLWLAGTLLQTPNALPMLDDAYRPWEKLHPDCDKSKEMHRTLDANLPDRKAALRIPADRKDAGPYKVVLLSVLKLFGEGIHESLQRTMGNYLEATNGKYTESRLEQWEIDRASGLLCHNNAAERPFGVMKWLKKMYPSMTISSLSHIAHAIVNGTYTEGRSAATADEYLKTALRKLCCIRQKTMGAITKMVRDDHVGDWTKREVHIADHRKTAEEKAMTTAKKRAVKVDTARETVMVQTTDELNLQLSTMKKKDG